MDGGADGGGVEPAPPATVTLTPCPAGFREASLVDGVVVCDPWADAEPPTCADGEARFVGEPGCARVGSPCPAGNFPEDVTASGDLIHVDIDADPGGDGSLDAPLTALSAAVADAGAGDVVLVAPGTYVSRVVIPAGVEVRGACPEATRVTMPVAAPALTGVVTPDGLDAQLTDVTIDDGADAGVFVREDTSIHLSGVIIDNTRFGGVVAVAGGRVTAESLVVRRAQPLEDGSFGRGLHVELATAEVRRASFENNRGAGVSAAGPGSSLRLEEVAILGTLPESATREFGRGINAQDGATITVERTLIEANRDVGIYAVDGEASISDVVVRGTLAQQSDNTAGRGLELDRSTAHLSRVLLDENRQMGLYADDATLTLEDVVIRRISPQPLDLDYGRGINVAGGNLSARRLFVEACHDLGIAVWNEGTSAELEDVTVRDTRPMEATGVRGRAMSALFGPQLTVRRGRFVSSHELGVSAVGPGTEVELEDVLISRVDEAACAATTCSDAPFGIGLGAYETARVSARRFIIEDASFCGVHLAVGGEIDLAQGRVLRSAIGACVQEDGYDVTRLTDDVAYVDNDVNLDATTLPLPPAASSGTPR